VFTTSRATFVTAILYWILDASERKRRAAGQVTSGLWHLPQATLRISAQSVKRRLITQERRNAQHSVSLFRGFVLPAGTNYFLSTFLLPFLYSHFIYTIQHVVHLALPPPPCLTSPTFPTTVTLPVLISHILDTGVTF